MEVFASVAGQYLIGRITASMDDADTEREGLLTNGKHTVVLQDNGCLILFNETVSGCKMFLYLGPRTLWIANSRWFDPHINVSSHLWESDEESREHSKILQLKRELLKDLC